MERPRRRSHAHSHTAGVICENHDVIIIIIIIIIIAINVIIILPIKNWILRSDWFSSLVVISFLWTWQQFAFVFFLTVNLRHYHCQASITHVTTALARPWT